jgi:hypothetical protein
MLDRPQDLIPVVPNAVSIPWSRRRSQILNYLHRGPVTFSTLVYDSNVGDISPLATYFNPDRITLSELNFRCPNYGEELRREEETGSGSNPTKKNGAEVSVKPRLLLYPDHSQEKVQRTLNWVMSQDSKVETVSPVSPQQLRLSQSWQNLNMEHQSSSQTSPLHIDCSFSNFKSLPSQANSLPGQPQTLPASALGSALDNVWSDKGKVSPVSSGWPEKMSSGSESGLGLGELASRLNTNSPEAELETGDRNCWSPWESSGPSSGPSF